LTIFEPMDADHAKVKTIHAAALMSVIIVGFYIILGFLPESGWWGINHLSFFPPYLKTLMIAIVIAAPLALFMKPIRRYIESSAVDPPRSAHYLQPLFWLVLFVILRTAVHSLGDGYQRASEIESGWLFQPTETLDFFIHAMLYRVLNLFGTVSAATAMAVTSIIAGVVFVYVLWKQNTVAKPYKTLFVWAVLSLGGTQLFFGYVESYTLVYLFGIWYVLLAFRDDKAQPDFIYISVIYLLAGFSHLVGIILLPSYLLLAHRRLALHRRRIFLAGLCFLISILPVAIPLLLARFIVAEPMTSAGEYLLPLWGDPYAVFSGRHLFDILNQFLLIAPLFIILSPFIPKARADIRNRLMVVSMVLPAFLFILLVDPKLSLPRDWDLFALPAALCVVPFMVGLFRYLNRQKKTGATPVAALILASFFIMMSWVYVNSEKNLHLERAEYILENSERNQKYGYEMLAYYYSLHQDYENELRILQSIDPLDRTAPVYGKMAQAAYLLGREDEAYRYAQTGARMPRPDRLNAIMAGMTAYDRGEYENAIYYLGIAAELTGDPQWLSRQGDAYRMIDSLERAGEIYHRVMNRNPSLAGPFFGLAELSYLEKDYQQAAGYCREGLRREPQSERGNRLLRDILNQLDTDKQNGH